VSRIRSRFEHVVRTEAAQLPLPGEGDTWGRFEALSKWAAEDLSLGRLVEGHADAIAILAESGMKPAEAGATYGVWAARSVARPLDSRLTAGTCPGRSRFAPGADCSSGRW